VKKPALALAVIAAALTASLVPALAGGGSGNDADQPPTATIAAGPIGPTNATSASFMFTTDQQDSRLYCALDSSDFGVCEPPVTYNGLVDGQHTFFVYAVKVRSRGRRPPGAGSSTRCRQAR
jgi:hypothetical protein